MAFKLAINPYNGELQLINKSTTGTVNIPELTADPVSPAPESAWVLKGSIFTPIGTPIGLLLALTYAGTSSPTYEFSYKTIEGPIVRAELT